MVKANTGNQGQVTDVYEETVDVLSDIVEWFASDGTASGSGKLAGMMPVHRTRGTA